MMRATVSVAVEKVGFGEFLTREDILAVLRETVRRVEGEHSRGLPEPALPQETTRLGHLPDCSQEESRMVEARSGVVSRRWECSWSTEVEADLPRR